MKRMFIGLMLALCSPLSLAHAKPVLKPELVLDHIKAIQTRERRGDQVYLDISTYRANQPTRYHRIPKHPIHWQSALIDKIKSVPLWSEEIKEGQEVILIISLMEQDLPSINPDDLIGSIRVKLKNKRGQLRVQWSLPNRVGGPIFIAGEYGQIEKFQLFDEQNQYEVYLFLRP